MHPRQLRTFVAAASCLNFSRAAQAVHLAPSSVSDQIQALETELGTALFDRSRRALRLTSAGVRLLDYAHRILALSDEARCAVTGSAEDNDGTIAIGSLETLAARWLAGSLAPLHRNLPGIGVTITISGSGGLREAITRGDLDLGFTIGTEPAGHDLSHRCVGRTGMIAILPSNRQLRHAAAGLIMQLASEPFIVTQTGCVYRKLVDDAFAAIGVAQPRIVAEVGSIAAIFALVEAGLGCAIVPRIAVSDEAANLNVKSLDEEIDPVPITMIWHPRRALCPVLGQFLAAMPTRPLVSD